MEVFSFSSSSDSSMDVPTGTNSEGTIDIGKRFSVWGGGGVFILMIELVLVNSLPVFELAMKHTLYMFY